MTYDQERVEALEAELERCHETIACLRQDVADALRLAQDYREAFERIEAELRELREQNLQDGIERDLLM